MKISQRKLKQIIKEEIQRALKEQTRNGYRRRGKDPCADPAMEGKPVYRESLANAICRGGRVVRVSEAAYNKITAAADRAEDRTMKTMARLLRTRCRFNKPGQHRRCEAIAKRLRLPAEPDNGRHGQEWGCTEKNRCGKIGGG